MSKKWYEQRTPEEQEAVRRFNAGLRNDAYGDYYLGGDEYIPEKSPQQLALDEAYEKATNTKAKPLPYDPYKAYQNGEAWRGYQAYKPALLDYRYIEQMANALASKHAVKVKVGDTWCIDIEKKELTYNPMTLMTGSKSRMIAGLLHEIGHLRHTTPVSQLKTNQKYGKSGHEVLNLYEDFRVDEIMSTAYSGAGSVYEANIPVIQEIAKGYGNKEADYRHAMVAYLQQYRGNLSTGQDCYGGHAWHIAECKQGIVREKKTHAIAKAKKPKDAVEKRERTNALSRATRHINNYKANIEVYKVRLGQTYDQLGLIGKDRTIAVALARVNEAIRLAENGETLLGYEALVLCEAYGVKPQGNIAPELQARVDKTKHAIGLSRVVGSTQEVVDTLNTHVYPHIKELLMNFESGENMEGLVGKKIAGEVAEYASRECGVNGNPEAREKQKSDGSGTGAEIPEDWANGNYDSLKSSVQSAINDLVQRLRFIRASDTANRYETNLKRGKLHGKHLYRLSIGNDRLFRKKTEQKDRVGQVGISLVIDKSGSMYNGNMVHTVRGAIMLAEACAELDIPIELMTFSGRNDTLKKHEDEYTKAVKDRLAGLVNADGGSSNMYASLDETKINDLKKRNKVCVILSDGGVDRGGPRKTYKQYFDEMKKHNVMPVGIGIQCGEEITRLVGAGKSTDNAYDLPAIFEGVMRDCINRIIKT